MKKKRLLSIGLSACLTLGVLAFSGFNVYAKNEEKKLTVWTYFSGPEQKAFEKQLKKFEKEKGIEIESQFIPFSDYKKQVSVAIGADTLPDILMIDNPDQAAFSAMGVFADITDKIKSWGEAKEFFKGPMETTMYNGKYYGIPETSNCLALFYNKKMLDDKKVDVPKTWDELKEAAKKLTNGETYGLAVASPKTEEATFQFMPWMISAGGQYDKLNSEGTKKAAKLWRDLIKDGYMSKEVTNWGHGDIEKQFVSEKAAMFIGGPWMIPQIKEDNDKLEFGVAFVPKDEKYASVLGGENLGINAKSKNIDLAWDLLKFLGSKDTVKDFISQTGYFPPRKDVAQDPIWQDDPIKKVFAEEMDYAVPRGPSPNWPKISEIIYNTLQEVEIGDKDVTAAFDDAQNQIEQYIK